MSVNDILSKSVASPATVRKDLTYLEQKGLISRTRGYAHLVPEPPVSEFSSRESSHSEEKKKIARIAARLVEDHDSIILDSGTTTLEIAKELVNHKDLTIVTNSIAVAAVLVNSSVNVLMSGGILKKPVLSLVGPDTEAYFKRIEASKLFLCANGVRSTIGLTTTSPFELNIKRNMIKAANKIYAVLDSSKFNTTSIDLFCEFSEIDCVITDKPIEDPALMAMFDKLNISVLCELT